VLVGRIHPEDADLNEPAFQLDSPRLLTALRQFATAERTVDEATALRLLGARPVFRDLRYTTARAKAGRSVTALGRESIWRQVTTHASRSFVQLGRARQVEAMAVLRDVVLGLVLRDKIGTQWSEFTQRDYDVLTGAWREQIGAIFPDDEDLFRPAP
jgi:hypothetical protein